MYTKEYVYTVAPDARNPPMNSFHICNYVYTYAEYSMYTKEYV